MGKYIVKRVILAIFTIFIISLITFFAMNAIPGGPFNSEKAKSPAVMNRPSDLRYHRGELPDFSEAWTLSGAHCDSIRSGARFDSSADAKQVAGSSYSILRHTDYVDAVICHRYVITLFLLYKAWRGAGLQLRKQHDITSGAVTVTFTDGIYYKTYKDFNA